MRRAALALFLLLLLAGCAQPRYSLDNCPPHQPPLAEEMLQSLRYRVRTDAGKSAAQEVTRFMERAAALWTPIFGVPDPLALPLEVQLYRDPDAVRELLASQNLTDRATGLYLPLSSPAIHVACWGKEPGHPYRTLLHEGTHQFAHLAAGYRLKGTAGGKPAPPRLAIPLWLSEGLATYFEAAYLEPDLLVAGNQDPGRLGELRTALQKGAAPSLEQLLQLRYGEAFGSLDYAAAWGVVFVLMQDEPPPWAVGGRTWLAGVLAEARRGWPGAGIASTAPPGYDPWWGLVTIAVRDSFLAFIAERGMTLPQWESEWRKWLLAQP